ncbi:MAG: hypothetical protein ACYCPR_02590 [Thermoplasmataceae archaeon]
MKLCELLSSTFGRIIESGYQMFDFIHEHNKLLSEGLMLLAFWKWQRIMGI